jgi:hypothetical protein
MECKLTITGSFADIQQALALLQGGKPVETEVQTFTPENYRHDPPADYTLKAIDLKRQEIMANGAALNLDAVQNPDLPVEPMQRIEKVNKRGPKPKREMERGNVIAEIANDNVGKEQQIHCQTCGFLFHPKRDRVRHCSKRCYMIEWRERNKPSKSAQLTKKVAPDAKNIAPDAKNIAKNIEKATDDLNRKLEQIRKTCPKPQPRPELKRDLL